MIKHYFNPSIISALIAIFGLASCSNDKLSISESRELLHQASEDIVFYNSDYDIVLKYQADPYTLDNFQKAYDILAEDEDFVKTRGLDDFFVKGNNLTPTDYALKIYPRSLKEQSEIENMDDVSVAYFPFQYTDAGKEFGTNDFESIEFDENPHYELIDTVYSDHGEVIVNQKITLPVLYVVWPYNKPLPEEYDYEIDYSVFIPQHLKATRASSDIEWTRILERKAMSLVFGDQEKPRTRDIIIEDPDSLYYRYIDGYFTTYDNQVMSNVGLENLQFRFQLGSLILTGYTLDDGYYTWSIEIPDNASFYCTFGTTKWKITQENSTVPISLYLGTIPAIMGDNPNYNPALNFNLSLSTPTLQIHRAVNYLYYGSHEIGVYNFSTPLRIKSMTTNNSTYAGVTHSSSSIQPYIEIFNNDQSYNPSVIYTTFHELGHAMHHQAAGGFSNYSACTSFLKESYATYVGWHGCCQYYNSIGYNSSFSIFAMQYWTPTISNPEYSPLFIDLIDSYNQNNQSSAYLKDLISGFPHSIIRQTIMPTCRNFIDVKNVLDDYIGQYYSASDYYTYVVGFGLALDF